MTSQTADRMTFYMHTIDGRPAQYYPDTGYICFTTRVTRLERTLYAIKKQRKAVLEKDAVDGNGLRFNYGHVRIVVPR